MRTCAHPESIARWNAFEKEPFVSLGEHALPDGMIPLSGTPDFEKLTPAEKDVLGRSFIQFTAEFFILLEGLLLIAFRSIRENPKAARVAGEEFYHSKAFRRFLRLEARLEFKRNRIMLGREPLTRAWRTAMFSLVRKVPLAMALPGAKIEAYSVAYGKHLRQEYGSESANSWVKLNHLHLLDEVHHVPFEFEIYNEVFDRQPVTRKVATVLSVAIFYLFLQWILITGCWKVTWRALRGRTFPEKISLSCAVLHWASRGFPPARQMRASTKLHFRQRSPRWASLLWYVQT